MVSRFSEAAPRGAGLRCGAASRHIAAVLTVAMGAVCGAAKAQTPPTTLAVSREVSLAQTLDSSAVTTLAVSREFSLGQNLNPSQPYTLAVSRESSLGQTLDPTQPYTLAVSRETSLFHGYLVPDAISSLRIAAGLKSATAPQAVWYNIVNTSPSTNLVDLLDVCKILKLALNPGSDP